MVLHPLRDCVPKYSLSRSRRTGEGIGPPSEPERDLCCAVWIIREQAGGRRLPQESFVNCVSMYDSNKRGKAELLLLFGALCLDEISTQGLQSPMSALSSQPGYVIAIAQLLDLAECQSSSIIFGSIFNTEEIIRSASSAQ